MAPKYDVCFYTFPSVLLALERVIALYAQLLRVNQTAVIVEEDFVLVAENVSEHCPIQKNIARWHNHNLRFLLAGSSFSATSNWSNSVI